MHAVHMVRPLATFLTHLLIRNLSIMKFEVLLAMGKELWLASFDNLKKRGNK